MPCGGRKSAGRCEFGKGRSVPESAATMLAAIAHAAAPPVTIAISDPKDLTLLSDNYR